MKTRYRDQEVHQARSEFVRSLVQGKRECDIIPASLSTSIPRTIVHFWHNLDQLPGDVSECMHSWRRLEAQGFRFLVFDDDQAKDFIAGKLGLRHAIAYGKCYHPAMQADYFRLCYSFIEGGWYIDADDVYLGCAIDYLCCDGRMKIQPLCYDTATGQMVPPSVFTEPGANDSSWIFYFNNNPLLAARGHPVVERALASATEALERTSPGDLPPRMVPTPMLV